MFADTLLLVVCANNAIIGNEYHNEFHDHVINSQSTVLCMGDLLTLSACTARVTVLCMHVCSCLCV